MKSNSVQFFLGHPVVFKTLQVAAKIASGNMAFKKTYLSCFRVGDEILSVNTEDISRKSYEDAVEFLEKIPQGRVTMVIKRPRAKPSLLLLDNESDYVGKAL
jgi:C-terminal processing protease CtpA/Prc